MWISFDKSRSDAKNENGLSLIEDILDNNQNYSQIINVNGDEFSSPKLMIGR